MPRGIPNSGKRAPAGTGLTAKDQITAGLNAADPRDPNTPNKTDRAERVPMGKQFNLDDSPYDLDKTKFYYRWVSESPDRPGGLNRAKAAYYEHHTDPQGNIVKLPGGGGLTVYLMRLPMKYRKEDEKLKQKKVDDIMRTEAKLAPNEYAPDPASGRPEGGTSAVSDEPISDNPYS